MAVKKKIRVIRTWECEVDAEYGDTDEDLINKVPESYLDDNEPDDDTRVILPDLDKIPDQSEYVPLDGLVRDETGEVISENITGEGI